MPSKIWRFIFVKFYAFQSLQKWCNHKKGYDAWQQGKTNRARFKALQLTTRPGLLEEWLALTSVKYHGNLWVLTTLNQRLALTRLRKTGPRAIKPNINGINWLHYIKSIYPSSTAWKAFLDTFDLAKCWKILLTKEGGIFGPDDFLQKMKRCLFLRVTANNCETRVWFQVLLVTAISAWLISLFISSCLFFFSINLLVKVCKWAKESLW